MNRFTNRLWTVFAFLFLVGFASRPLSAQLNPTYYNNLKTDFLDLYQQSNNQTVKPEIVTLLDYSGSMNQIMFDGRFPNDIDEESNAPGCSIQIVIKPTGTYATGNWGLNSITFVRSSNHSYLSSLSGKDYATGSSVNYAVGGLYTDGNKLMRVQSDGSMTEVTADYVNKTNVTSSYVTENKTDAMVGVTTATGVASASALNWMRAATHVRVKVKGGSVDRWIDIPLNYTALNEKSYSDVPPVPPARVLDPVTSTYFAYDTTYINDSTSGTCWDYTSASYRTSSSASANFVDTVFVGNEYASWAGWRQSYLCWIFSAKSSTSTYCIPSVDTAPGFLNGLKGVTRLQAMKQAIIETWVEYQNDVFWMIRGLNDGESNSGGATQVNSQIATMGSTLTDVENNSTSGGDRRWFTLNKHKGKGLRRISKCIANTSTALTTSYSNTLAQFMNKTALQEVENNEVQTLECTRHFLIVCTDGAPTNDGTLQEATANLAYYDSTGKGSRVAGNTRIKNAGLDSLDLHQSFWNISTLAGVAAHGGKTKTTDTDFVADNTGDNVTNGTEWLSNFAPFHIPGRPSLDFKLSHPIQTMTLGMSLTVSIDSNGVVKPIQQDTSSPKYRLLATALAGNPSVINWDITTARPFDKSDTNPTYFFDATSPESMVDNLKEAFKQALTMSQVGSTAMPGFPFVGSGFGNQVYLAKFAPPENGGPVWAGDLVMFPTKRTSSGTALLTSTGTEITGNVNLATPQWSVGKLFDPTNGTGYVRQWYDRRMFTRVPKQTPLLAKEGQLVPFRDWDADSAGFSDFKGALPYDTNLDAATNLTRQRTYVRFLMGADVDTNNDMADMTKVPNRVAFDSGKGIFTKGVVGDIINSSPAAIEFNNMTLDKLTGLPAGSPLRTELAKNGVAGNAVLRRFRMIFVGTNLGVLHAFGEVAWEENVTLNNTSVVVTKGVVDELWSFVPSDFLKNLDYLRNAANPHRYMVDGSPIIYHLDLPLAATEVRGNGKMDMGTSEEAMVIFGLGKGGRSYYALDIRDPMNPKLAETTGTVTRGWALVPDEATAGTAVANMGMSTAQPMVGRMITGDGTKYLKDLVFLGGGYSTKDLDTAMGRALGRSVHVLHVLSGNVEHAPWTLDSTVYGPVDAGVVPFEMVPNSGLIQRAYFTDHTGKVLALGKNTYKDYSGASFLEDSSELAQWGTSARLVYKADFAPALNNVNASLPAPFRVTSWPARRQDPKVSPPVVGIAMVTGDRFDPADRYPEVKQNSLRPSRFRTLVLFDRNDHKSYSTAADGIPSSSLQDFTTVTSTDARIKPGSSTYYLDPTTGTPSFGYQIAFPVANNKGYLPKGMFSPLVFLGVMAYSYFEPLEFDPCQGGSGMTHTNRICNVILPVFPGNGVSADNQTAINNCKAGEVWTWIGVASRISLQSLTSAVQAGLEPSTNPNGSAGSPDLKVKSMTGMASERFVRPRVWRTVM